MRLDKLSEEFYLDCGVVRAKLIRTIRYTYSREPHTAVSQLYSRHGPCQGNLKRDFL